VIDIRRHNANFCAEHFLRLCRDQVAKAIRRFEMFDKSHRVLVAVSGGKDSLALWDILTHLGYTADGFYLDLGIEAYSSDCAGYARRFAESRGLELLTGDLLRDHGFDIGSGARAARRSPCSACGLSKRHLFDEAARSGGYDVLATGHNLDDEAAVLLGNTLRWQVDYLGRQLPVLEARDGFGRKVKPLVRLTERETAAYCVVRGIDYAVEECPMAAGNRHLAYKAALNDIEERSPGAKYDFYFGFLARASERFRVSSELDRAALAPCSTCGAPTDGGVCAFCRLAARAAAPAPVRFTSAPAPADRRSASDPERRPVRGIRR